MTREAEPRPLRPFGELSDTGMLWLINRVVFHPRGFALAIHRDDDGNATGWAMQGMGDEVWTFTNEADDECFAKVEAFIASLRPVSLDSGDET